MDWCYLGGRGMTALLRWTVATADVSMAAVAEMDCCYFGEEVGRPPPWALGPRALGPRALGP